MDRHENVPKFIEQEKGEKKRKRKREKGNIECATAYRTDLRLRLRGAQSVLSFISFSLSLFLDISLSIASQPIGKGRKKKPKNPRKSPLLRRSFRDFSPSFGGFSPWPGARSRWSIPSVSPPRVVPPSLPISARSLVPLCVRACACCFFSRSSGAIFGGIPDRSRCGLVSIVRW